MENFIYPQTKLTEEEKVNLKPADRLKICESCDKFNKKFRTCSTCGCFMDIKTKIKSMHCPLNVW